MGLRARERGIFGRDFTKYKQNKGHLFEFVVELVAEPEINIFHLIALVL